MRIWKLHSGGHWKDIKEHLLCLEVMYIMIAANSQSLQHSRGIKHINLITRVLQHSKQKSIHQTSIIFRSIFEFNLKCD